MHRKNKLKEKKTPTTEFLVTRCMMDYFNCFQVLLILLIEIFELMFLCLAWHGTKALQ